MLTTYLSRRALIAAAAIPGLRAQDREPVPIGVVAGHALMRVAAVGGVAEAFGYFPFVDGLGNLFNGPRGERNAMLSFRTGRFNAGFILNGRVLYIRPILNPGAAGLTFDVFHDPDPRRSFAEPATFSTGTKIAEFRGDAASIVALEESTVSYVANLRLMTSSKFTIGDTETDFASIARAIQVRVTGPSPEFDKLADGGAVSIALGGSFLAAAVK